MRTNDEVIAYVDKLRKEQNISMNELARRTGLAKSSISRYFNKSRQFPVNKIDLFAKALHVKVEDILGVEPFDQANNKINVKGMHYVRVPIIGTIACGDPITAEQNVEGYTHELFDEEPSGTLFALRCKGDSMEPLIPDGAVVLIHEQPTVEDDEIAAVQVNDDTEATLKKVKHTHDGQIMLMPINTEKYDPILLNKENPGRILGKVIHVGFDM